MTSPRARPVLLALLGILAIALAAATLNSAVAVDGGFGLGEPGDFGTGPDAPGGPNGSSSTPAAGPMGSGNIEVPTFCVPILASGEFRTAVAVLFLGVAYGLYRRNGPLLPIGLTVAIGPFAMLLYVVLTACEGFDGADDQQLRPGAGNLSGDIPAGVGNGTGGGAGGAIAAPSVLLLGALAVVLIAAVALLFVTSNDQQLDVPEEDVEDEPGRAPEAIGRIAGRAADRIEEDAEIGNEVFRAWHEMTTYLDVPNPESSAPGEFADAAVAAGMEREDVSTLTRLFEEVRYGTAEPTGERERDAVEALRRIERTYAEDPP